MAKSTLIVLLNLDVWNNPKKPGQGNSLDVVQEVNEGRSFGVGVEKVYFLENGTKRIPKKMERKDFKTCADRWPEILGLMNNPPPIPAALPPPGIGDGTWGDRGAGLTAKPLESVPMTSAPIEKTSDEF